MLQCLARPEETSSEPPRRHSAPRGSLIGQTQEFIQLKVSTGKARSVVTRQATQPPRQRQQPQAASVMAPAPRDASTSPPCAASPLLQTRGCTASPSSSSTSVTRTAAEYLFPSRGASPGVSRRGAEGATSRLALSPPPSSPGEEQAVSRTDTFPSLPFPYHSISLSTAASNPTSAPLPPCPS